MNRWIKVALAGSALGIGTIFACGGDVPSPKLPEPPVTSAVPSSVPSAAPSSIASVAPSASAAPDAGPAVPAMKGTFNAFTRAANTGKVDKVGEKDGSLKPDGVKDQVFDVDFEGAATAFFIMTCDKEGTLTSEFDADTLVGSEKIPKEIAGVLNAGRNTAGIAIYEGDKLANRPNGGVTFGEGRHKLTMYVSAKDYPKGPVKIFALLPDSTLITGPVLK